MRRKMYSLYPPFLLTVFSLFPCSLLRDATAVFELFFRKCPFHVRLSRLFHFESQEKKPGESTQTRKTPPTRFSV